MSIYKADPWWAWRWDTLNVDHKFKVGYQGGTRWRRGSFLTVYRFKQTHETQWWFFLPFNFAIGFAIPKRGADKNTEETSDEDALM